MLKDEKSVKKFLLDLYFKEKNYYYEQICLELMKYNSDDCPNMEAAKSFDKSEFRGLIENAEDFKTPVFDIDILGEMLKTHHHLNHPAIKCLNEWCDENGVKRNGVLYNRILAEPEMRIINRFDITESIKRNLKSVKRNKKEFLEKAFEKQIPNLCRKLKLKSSDLKIIKALILEQMQRGKIS